MNMTADEAMLYGKMLYPDSNVSFVGFPWPIKEADINANNAYLQQCRSTHEVIPVMCVRPEWNAENCEQQLVAGNFAGFKPYPDLVAQTGVKGPDVSIFSFIPHDLLRVLDKHKKALVLHLPRKGRFADIDNINELRNMRQKYPNIRIVIAHFGRCFNEIYLIQAIQKLKNEINDFYYDTAAVSNKEVYKIAFDHIDDTRILYGTDMPILLWHGKSVWTRDSYIHYCAENLPWKRPLPQGEDGSQYTLFIYEQLKAIFLAAQECHYTTQQIQNIFANNARKVFR
jgi:hypothetical protein